MLSPEPYLIALLATSVLSILLSWEMAKICFIVAVAWFLATGFNVMFETLCPWLWFLVLDAAVFCAIVHFTKTKTAIFALIVCFLQVALDGGYGAIQILYGFPADPVARYEYYEWMGILAYVQLICIAGGGMWNGGRRSLAARLRPAWRNRTVAGSRVQSARDVLDDVE